MNDLISRQAAIDDVWNISKIVPTLAIRAKDALEAIPSAQQEIIRCGDCKYFDDRPGWQGCQAFGKWFGETEMYGNDFCSKAERRTDE